MDNTSYRAAITAALCNGICKTLAPNTADAVARLLCFQTLDDVESNFGHMSQLDEVGIVRLIPTGYFNLTYGTPAHFRKWSSAIPEWHENIYKSRDSVGELPSSQHKLRRVLVLAALSAVQRLPLAMPPDELEYVGECIRDGLVLNNKSSIGAIRERLGNTLHFEDITLQALISVVSENSSRSFDRFGNLHVDHHVQTLANALQQNLFLPQIIEVLNRYKDRADGRVTFLLALQYLLVLRQRLIKLELPKHHLGQKNSVVDTIERYSAPALSSHFAFASVLKGIFDKHIDDKCIPPQPSEQMLILANGEVDHAALEAELRGSFYLDLWAFNAVTWMVTPFDIPQFRNILERDVNTLPGLERDKARLILKFRRIIVEPLQTMPSTFTRALEHFADRTFSRLDNGSEFHARLQRMRDCAETNFLFDTSDRDWSEYKNGYHLVGGAFYSLRSSEYWKDVLYPATHRKHIFSSLREAALRDAHSPAAILFYLCGALGAGNWLLPMFKSAMTRNEFYEGTISGMKRAEFIPLRHVESIADSCSKEFETAMDIVE